MKGGAALATVATLTSFLTVMTVKTIMAILMPITLTSLITVKGYPRRTTGQTKPRKIM